MHDFSIIVAATQKNHGIGFQNSIPWKLKQDMVEFVRVTCDAKEGMQNVVIMGRKTWESIPQKHRPLANRFNIVLTRSKNLDFPGAHQASSLKMAFGLLPENTEKVFIAGGSAIYAEALLSPYCKQIYMTVVFKECVCDTFFPPIDTAKFQLTTVGLVQQENEVMFQFVKYTQRHEEYQYLDLISSCITTGNLKSNRTGIDTYSHFGKSMRFNLRDGTFPLLTTKTVFWRGVVEELLWLIKGCTDSKQLSAKRVKIWDANGSREFLDKLGFQHRAVGDLGPCFVANTTVLTLSGVKNIQEINKTDLVLTHTGLFKPVLSTMERQYTGELYKIKPHYTGLVITTTPEHPFYARKYHVRSRLMVNGTECRNVIQAGQPRFVFAKDLVKTSHFLGMKIEDEETIPTFKLRRYVNQHVDYENYDLTLDNPAFYWMMGYFVGDGWITEEKNGPRIFFVIADKDIEVVVPRLREVLNVSMHTNTGKKEARPAPACKTYRVYNRQTASILADFGKYAYGKKIPDWLLKAPKSFIRIFLDGYVAADGCRDDDSERIVTVSRDLAVNVQRLYAKLGSIVSVSLTYRAHKPKVIINETECNQRDVYQIENYIRPKRRHTYSFIENGYVWYSICNIEKIEATNINVYNLSVEGDESYTANSVAVHNCYGHQWRHFGAPYVDCKTNYVGQGTDQLAEVIRLIKTDPNSRRIILCAWNPTQLPEMALPPCHVLSQFHVFDGELSCLMFQRSADCALGIPFNIASYSLLTYLIAHVCGLSPGDFIHFLGDTHVYDNHVASLAEQLVREPRPFPKLKINPNKTEINDFVFEDFDLIGYTPHDKIIMQMAV